MSTDVGSPSAAAAENTPHADRALTDPVNWAALSHRELFAAVHQNNRPAQGHELSREWTGQADEVVEAAAHFEDSVRRSAEGWQGEAAEAARTHLLGLARRSTELAGIGREIGACLAEQSAVMERAKQAMPEPLDFDLDKALHANFATPGLDGMVASASALKPLRDAVDSRHQQAVDVMVTMESDSRVIDEKVPGFVPERMRTREGEAPATVAEPAQTSVAASQLSTTTTAPMSGEPATAKVAQPGPATPATPQPDPQSTTRSGPVAPAAGLDQPTTAMKPVTAAPAAGLDQPTMAMKPVTAAGPGTASPADLGSAATSNASALSPQMPQHAPMQSGTPGAAPTTAPSSGGAVPTEQQWSRNHVSAQAGRLPRSQGNAQEGTKRIPRPGGAADSSLDAPTAKMSLPKRDNERDRPERPDYDVPETPLNPDQGGPVETPNWTSVDGTNGGGGPASFADIGGAVPSTAPLQPGGHSAARPVPGAGAAAAQWGAVDGTAPPESGQGESAQSGAVGGMPRGAAGGGMQQGGQDAERTSRGYLKDQSVVDQPERGAPVVLGEKFKKKS